MKRVGVNKIPRARVILLEVLVQLQHRPDLCELLDRALELMYREKPVHKARAKRCVITDDQRLEIKYLHSRFPNMALVDIADTVGLGARALGRVSEILHGLR